MAAMPNAAPVIVGAKVEPELKRRLVDLARTNERTVSQEMRLALRRHVQDDVSLQAAALAAANS